MGFLDNIFGGGQQQTWGWNQSSSSSQSETGPEKWIRDEGREATNLAISSLPTSYQRYGGERVAGYGDGYQTGKNIVAQMGRDENATYGASAGKLDSLWNNASKALTTDARGYMNPFTDAVLTPQLRKIEEARAQQAKADRREATMAGAFGDPQAGIARTLSNDKFNTLVSDTTGKTYADAYEKGRLEREADLGRLYQGYGLRRDLDQSHFNNNSQLAKANVNFGIADQAQQQKLDDVAYDEWKNAMGWRVNRAQTINTLLKGTPQSTMSASTGTGTGNSTGISPAPNYGAQMVGQVAGAALGGGFGDKLGDWLFG